MKKEMNLNLQKVFFGGDPDMIESAQTLGFQVSELLNMIAKEKKLSWNIPMEVLTFGLIGSQNLMQYRDDVNTALPLSSIARLFEEIKKLEKKEVFSPVPPKLDTLWLHSFQCEPVWLIRFATKTRTTKLLIMVQRFDYVQPPEDVPYDILKTLGEIATDTERKIALLFLLDAITNLNTTSVGMGMLLYTNAGRVKLISKNIMKDMKKYVHDFLADTKQGGDGS